MLHRFANPGKFLRYAQAALPWLVALCALCLGAGLYLAMFDSPPDYQQGEAVRIMYIHVPSAWLSLMIYSGMALASAVYLIWKHPLADVLARASAAIGAAFTLLTLITGSLWGKPMWGTWWSWDARLTSELILFFLYLGYMAVADGFDEEERGKKASAILALIGFVNVPIIKFSVDWWHTLHQPASILRAGGPSIHPSMLMPLLLMILGFTLVYLCLLIIRARAELLETKIRRLQFQAVSGSVAAEF